MDTEQLLRLARKVVPFAIFVPVSLAQSDGDPRSLVFFVLVAAVVLGVAIVPRILKDRGIGETHDRSGSPMRGRHADDIMSTYRPDAD